MEDKSATYGHTDQKNKRIIRITCIQTAHFVNGEFLQSSGHEVRPNNCALASVMTNESY